MGNVDASDAVGTASGVSLPMVRIFLAIIILAIGFLLGRCSDVPPIVVKATVYRSPPCAE